MSSDNSCGISTRQRTDCYIYRFVSGFEEFGVFYRTRSRRVMDWKHLVLSSLAVFILFLVGSAFGECLPLESSKEHGRDTDLKMFNERPATFRNNMYVNDTISASAVAWFCLSNECCVLTQRCAFHTKFNTVVGSRRAAEKFVWNLAEILR